MHHGPWIFRFWVMLLLSYDGLSRAEVAQFMHMTIWLQIHKLPYGYCNEDIVKKPIKKAGKVLEVRLSGNSHGDYIRIRVHH